jgi:OST-HTH/LOTUS domain
VEHAAAVSPGEAEAPPVTGGIADVRRIFARSKPQRFPMYIRNVKQLLRQTEPGFDERRYGFANLVDLLRAAQREGIVRLERDRQGALRVFQGPQWASASGPIEVAPEPIEATTISVEAAAIGDEPGASTPVVEAEVVPQVDAAPQPEKRRGRRPKAAGNGEASPKRGRSRAAKPASAGPTRRRTRKTASAQEVTVK